MLGCDGVGVKMVDGLGSSRTVDSTPSSAVASGVKKMRLTVPQSPALETGRRAAIRPGEDILEAKKKRLEKKQATAANATQSFASGLRQVPAQPTTDRHHDHPHHPTSQSSCLRARLHACPPARLCGCKWHGHTAAPAGLALMPS